MQWVCPMVLLLVDAKQFQMEFGGDDTDMFMEGPQKTTC